MRKLIVLFVVVAAFSASAQEVPPSMVMGSEVSRVVQRYQQRVDALAKAINRDAYIVGQMVFATQDLNDFQLLSAVVKAHDRVRAAQKRASEDPVAPRGTTDTLRGLDELLTHAEQQGTMADPAALRREILERTHFIQRALFRQLDIAQGERTELTNLQKRISETNLAVEEAMLRALATTFDFIRAGGK